MSVLSLTLRVEPKKIALALMGSALIDLCYVVNSEFFGHPF